MTSFFQDSFIKEGVQQMTQLIHSLRQDESPLPAPSSLRTHLPPSLPPHPTSFEELLRTTRQHIYPHQRKCHSKRYFGMNESMSGAAVVADMLTGAFNNPMFMYHVAPSYTELQNLVVDWFVEIFALPPHFLLKHSGGGIINNTLAQSILVSIHAAKAKTMQYHLRHLSNSPTAEAYQVIEQRLVAYYGEEVGCAVQKSLFFKDVRNCRAIPYKGQQLDTEVLRIMVQKDVEAGLIPFWFGASCASNIRGVNDLSKQLVGICKKYSMWINLDAGYRGNSWVLESERIALLQEVDSIQVDLSKQMMVGLAGCLFYVANKKQFLLSMNPSTQFSFYKSSQQGVNNKQIKQSRGKQQNVEGQSVVDYKDWIIGLGRRTSALKVYYFIKLHGLKDIRKQFSLLKQRALHLRMRIQSDSNLFELISHVFGIIVFQCKDAKGAIDNQLTKEVISLTQSIPQGHSNPILNANIYYLRIIIGSFQTQIQDIDCYYQRIRQATRNMQQ